ncbi:hypothetical protein [Microbacterium karelineae]|uniref:hypothetical protein n=1 Tax=Microbacterium karelineae TaxID=2654283 RepID=UPI0012EA3C36|nr:hypothetical protein [Microbacterium karelineae]
MRTLLTGGAAALLVLSLTACGGSDEQPDEEPAVSTAPADDTPAEAETDPDDAGSEDDESGAAAELPTCEGAEVSAAADIILSQIDAPTLQATEIEGVTSCLWYGEPESLSVNVQPWLLGGDVPDDAWFEAGDFEPLDDPAIAERDIVALVDTEFDGQWGSVLVWGAGYQVMVQIQQADISQDDAIDVADTLIDSLD